MASATPTQTPTPTSAETLPSCTNAIPDENGWVPPDACNAYYGFYPSFGANTAFAVLLFFPFTMHVFQMFYHKKKFCWVVVMGAAWDVTAFALRAAGSKKQQDINYVISGTLLLLLAPLWINAFVYMTLSRLIHFLLPEQKVIKLKATWLTKIFVWLDVVSFIIQAAGGSMMSNSGETPANIIRIGQQVYMTGVGLQAFFIFIFLFAAYKFHRRFRELSRERLVSVRGVNRLAWTLYIVLVLILIRIFYRIAEFAPGLTPSNPLLSHEWYSFALDGTPMLIALTLLNIFHPGTVLRGPESEFPKLSRKEKKMLKQEKKEAKLAAKAGKKASRSGNTLVPGHVEQRVSDEYEMYERV